MLWLFYYPVFEIPYFVVLSFSPIQSLGVKGRLMKRILYSTYVQHEARTSDLRCIRCLGRNNP